MNELKLVYITSVPNSKIEVFKSSFANTFGDIVGSNGLGSFSSVDEWKSHCIDDGRTGSLEFAVLEPLDGEMVGCVNIKVRDVRGSKCFMSSKDLTVLRSCKVFNNISCSVSPGCRGHGFGTEQIALALEYLRGCGVHKAYMSCVDGDFAAERVITNNGGVILGVYVIDDGDGCGFGQHYKRFIVDI